MSFPLSLSFPGINKVLIIIIIIVIIIMAAHVHCCQCNGVNAKCIRCARAKKKSHCVSCLPSKSNNCQNLLSCRQKAVVKAKYSPSVSYPSSPSDFIDSLAPDHTALTISKTVSSSRHSKESSGDESPNLSSSKDHIEAVGHYLGLATEDNIHVHQLMQRAYGESFIHSGGVDITDTWFQCWKKVVKLQGRYYVPS